MAVMPTIWASYSIKWALQQEQDITAVNPL